MNVNVNFKGVCKEELDALREKLGGVNNSVAIRYAVHQTVLFFAHNYPIMDNQKQNPTPPVSAN